MPGPRTISSTRVAAASLALAGALWLGSCDVGKPPTGPGACEPCDTDFAAIVSDPVANIAAARRSAAAGLRATTQGDVAYISLPPQTIPNGATGDIRNTRTGTTMSVTIVDGGFDPVPVEAAPGDVLAFHVHLRNGGEVRFLYAVPTRRAPVVVRTDPPPRKRDVPLNATMIIVFSEPIDPATLTASTVRLLRDGTPVAGRLELLSADRVTAAFAPAAPLAASTSYELVISRGVLDLDGEPLEAAVTIEFTTNALPPPAPAFTVLVDASRDGGVWWFPQSGTFDAAAGHQGKALADYFRSLGARVDELPRPFGITSDILRAYDIVIRANAFGTYTAAEVAAYQAYVEEGGKLLLLNDHMLYAPPDAVGLGFGIEFAAITRGENLIDRFAAHPVTAGVQPLGYGVGSGVVSYPPAAQILGHLSAGSYLDINKNDLQDAGEPSAPAVLGVLTYGAGRIVFCGDTNTWEWIPQPLVDNLLAWFGQP